MGWSSGRIDDLTIQVAGFSFRGDHYSYNSGITVVRGENVTEKRLRWDTHKKWNQELEDRMKKCFLKKYDIVIGMDGSKVGKNWSLIYEQELPLLLAQRVTCIRANSGFESFYVYMSLIINNFYEYVYQIQTGTSVPHISGQQIADFPLIIPTDSVIEFFSKSVIAVFERVGLNIQTSKKLEELKDLILAKMTNVEN